MAGYDKARHRRTGIASVPLGILGTPEMTGVGGDRASGAAVRLCQIVLFAAAGTVGTASQAEAALYYWSDFNPGYFQPPSVMPQRW